MPGHVTEQTQTGYYILGGSDTPADPLHIYAFYGRDNFNASPLTWTIPIEPPGFNQIRVYRIRRVLIGYRSTYGVRVKLSTPMTLLGTSTANLSIIDTVTTSNPHIENFNVDDLPLLWHKDVTDSGNVIPGTLTPAGTNELELNITVTGYSATDDITLGVEMETWLVSG